MEHKELHKHSNALVSSLEDVFKQAPHLPNNVRDVLVQIAPWLALIFGILGVIAGIGLLGVSPLALLGGVNASITVFLYGIISIIGSVLMVMAYPKLAKRRYGGWMLLFWAELVNALAAVLSIFNGSVSVGSFLGILLGMYLLFEVKSYYK